MRPNDDALALALGAFRDDWICAEDICSVLRHLGVHCSSRQAAAVLRRMEREDHPRIEGLKSPFGNYKEYRLTGHGRATLTRRFPGIEVKAK